MRFFEIDIAKGIGIVLVVLGHALAYGCPNRLFTMIYAFHMPLFFFLSGFVFKPKNSVFDFVLGKIKSLLLPLVFFQFADNVIFYILKVAGKESCYGLVNFGGLWFITTLFYVSCLYYMIGEVALRNNKHRNIVLFFISLVSLVLGLKFAKCMVNMPNIPIATTAVAIFFYAIGGDTQRLVRPFFSKLSDRRFGRITLLSAAGGLMFFIWWYTGSMPCEINMYRNRYVNNLCFPFVAICGIFSVLFLGMVLHRNRVFEWLGRHSLIIYISHIPMWKVIDRFFEKYAHMGGGRSLLVFILSLSGACLFAAFVEQYAPWLEGKINDTRRKA